MPSFFRTNFSCLLATLSLVVALLTVIYALSNAAGAKVDLNVDGSVSISKSDANSEATLTDFRTSSAIGLEKISGRSRDVFVIGDVHGNLEGMKQVLLKAQIIEENSVLLAPCEWSRSIRDNPDHEVWVVQVGDIVDRGNMALESWKCLENLQDSEPSNAKLFRMLGNHELWWLEGHIHMKAPADTTANIKYIVDSIKKDVLNDRIFGSVAFSTAKGDVIITHAGVQGGFLPYFERKFTKKVLDYTSDRYDEVVNAYSISADINQEVKNTIKACSKSGVTCSFSDKLFKAGKDRGGTGIGGPFWSDFKSVLASYYEGKLASVNFTQIVGHTASTCAHNSDNCIRSSNDGNIICVDGGLYMGSNSFLTVSYDGVFESHEYDENTGDWIENRRIKG